MNRNMLHGHILTSPLGGPTQFYSCLVEDTSLLKVNEVPCVLPLVVHRLVCQESSAETWDQ